MIPNDATRAQISAADPSVSTWLSANAGSGKTRVLTDRVARMLLSGVSPQRVLCLTYTKAAASEMQNRLFERLGEWAMMPDPKLRKSLDDLGIPSGQLDDAELPKARKLFAKAIETPGGLKIQTIHSFCASLLRRFPLEAGVSPAFVEMDDRAANQLRSEILEQIAEDDPDAMAVFARHFTGQEADDMLAQMAGARNLLRNFAPEIELRKGLELAPAITLDDVMAQVFLGDEQAIIDEALPHLMSGKDSDIKLAKAVRSLDLNAPTSTLLPVLEGLFLSGGDTTTPFRPKRYPPTKDVRTAMPQEGAAFLAFRERVADARPIRIALESLAKTQALHQFASVFLPRLEQRKQARGWLDFDDLIDKARALLSNPSVAAWVLYRLDGGIDHILVDEAQDTSPAQWDVIELLSAEFTAGASAREDAGRTIFVVGDQKQSIYSFQGADPAEFDTMRGHFGEALKNIGQDLQDQNLLYSFRSSAPILNLVDHTMRAGPGAGMEREVQHFAFKEELPGRVDLWDWIDKDKDDYDVEWYQPLDTVGSNHHTVKLARRIAEFIQDRLANGRITQVGKDGPVTRAITARDFLILVQRRSRHFHAIIRACKELGLPLAGADRLRIGGELGVRDLTALLSYLATPEDDLSLATVLRSPLGGLSEAELHSVAHGRKGTLRAAFENAKDRFPECHEMLRDLRGQADYLRPFDLLERCLTRHNGRKKLLSRLGMEAEEGITALLDQAQSFEASAIPGLTSFLTWLENDEVTIKRQISSEADEIRVMTVHGAKGLEAPIVILPDTGTTHEQVRDDILDQNGTPFWKPKSDVMPAEQQTIIDAVKIKQAEERMRLLYVAMTRAESWLVVCGSGEVPKGGSAASWYTYVQRGMEAAGAEPETGMVARLSEGVWPEDEARDTTLMTETLAELPHWTAENVAKPVKPVEPLSPSDLGGAKALPGATSGLDEDQAMARGTMIHRLLEHLPKAPPENWPQLAANLLSSYSAPNDEDLLGLATRILHMPELDFLFAPGTLAEVPITAALPELDGQRISGVIDRLILDNDRVLAVDFKTNVIVPSTARHIPDGILRQLGAYLSALEQIYTGKHIEIAVLWTETGHLMGVPHDIVRTPLQQAHTS